MANGTIVCSSTNSKLEGRINWSSSSNGSSKNTSNVWAELQMRRNDGYTTKGTWSGQLSINNEVKDFSISSLSIGSSWTTMISYTINDVKHNDDGTGSVHIWAKGYAPSGTSLAGQSVNADTSVNMDKIPRYFSGWSVSQVSNTLNSVTIQWNTNETRDWTGWSFQMGISDTDKTYTGSATYSENVSSDGKSGTFEIRNLDPRNKSRYNCCNAKSR